MWKPSARRAARVWGAQGGDVGDGAALDPALDGVGERAPSAVVLHARDLGFVGQDSAEAQVGGSADKVGDGEGLGGGAQGAALDAEVGEAVEGAPGHIEVDADVEGGLGEARGVGEEGDVVGVVGGGDHLLALGGEGGEGGGLVGAGAGVGHQEVVEAEGGEGGGLVGGPRHQATDALGGGVEEVAQQPGVADRLGGDP
jgi:hypothetical protein